MIMGSLGLGASGLGDFRYISLSKTSIHSISCPLLYSSVSVTVFPSPSHMFVLFSLLFSSPHDLSLLQSDLPSSVSVDLSVLFTVGL